MAYAYVKTIYAGTNVITLPFSYLSTDDVYLWVNDVLRPQSEITWTSPSIVTITTAGLTAGDVLLIARSTNIASMDVVYSNDTQLTKVNLNNANTQLLYLNQETRDFTILANSVISEEVEAQVAIAEAAASNAADSAAAALVSETNAAASAESISMPSIFEYIKTVDGSGSGLDADTLDGYHLTDIDTYLATFFTPLSHVSTTTAHSSTSANAASRIVQRDSSGNFSAGIIDSKIRMAETTPKYVEGGNYPFVASKRGSMISVISNDLDEYQGNCLYYLPEDPDNTLSVSGGVTESSAKNAFKVGDTYTTLTNSSGDVVITLLASIASDTDVSSIRGYIQNHKYIEGTIKYEVLTALDAWVTVLNTAVDLENYEYVFTPAFTSAGVTYPSDFPLKGVRVTFSGLVTATSYLRQIGVHRGSGRYSKSWVDKGGDSVYGDINFISGTCTVQDNPVWHSGNDGPGSGLDADTLDGYHLTDIDVYLATFFAPLSHVSSTSVHSATSSNTASRIVMRDASGNFSAGTVTGNLTGTASQATKLVTPRSINVSGGVTGVAQNFDGTGNITIPTTITAADALTAIKTVDGVGSGLDADTLDGYHIADVTTYLATSYAPLSHVSSTTAHSATSANTASRIVSRDASGNFAAGVITANLIGTATSATYAAQLINTRTFNVSGDVVGSAQNFNGTGNVTIPTTLAKKPTGTNSFKRRGNIGGSDNVTISTADGTSTLNFSTSVYSKGSGSTASTFTAPVAGLYHFNACIRYTATTDAASFIAVNLYAAGYSQYYVNNVSNGTVSGDIHSINISEDVYLTASQTIQLIALKGGGGSVLMDLGASTWSGHLIIED